ncbi:LysR family transcriptional regulator [Azospirillum baldaniorum]|uniref:Transcriptional regulatory protein,LysR family n=1 Tax=Azospirillum baldaniorum TaxID=1064539 RepID=A0A9P1JQ58_9PROT|nr:LysR family transcriptional regulator [Azospirillum baldaniorum]AWJ90307.1 LysR family transcriptional regulator [Azospirillum baldaniorum]TWA60629.1 LysR family transcriptional regulator [Azospirillum baldaniorum]TWA66999.1 LysR family transcriptional regulator [Azospirillum brasilense]CCC97591.1 putative transcriptional regulatory protein,LysR family [Azospirillum baldaniorum]
MSDPFEGMAAFLAVAETLNFRRASERLGVTRSAVSQTVRRLEDRIGVPLLQRTTRSVRLTDAGAHLLAATRPALAEIGTALEVIASTHGAPGGTLRLAVSSIAESILEGEALAGFLAAYPSVGVDILVTDEEFDIVAAGFDAGVRLGEAIEQDMIAVPVSTPQRQLVVASPAYLAEAGRPSHPRDLLAHRCIGWRPAPDVAPYRWEFTEEGRDFDIAVSPRVATNDMGMMVRLALAGAGLTCGMEETFRPHLERGALEAVLEEFCPPFAGFHLYYPSRRTVPPRLRALIDHLRARNGASTRASRQG